MEFNANQPIKEVSIEAVIIRADGTREDLGVIAHQTFDKDKSKLRLKPSRTIKGVVIIRAFIDENDQLQSTFYDGGPVGFVDKNPLKVWLFTKLFCSHKRLYRNYKGLTILAEQGDYIGYVPQFLLGPEEKQLYLKAFQQIIENWGL